MRTIKVEVWDDLDHEIPADQTRTIGIDGVWYEADLSDANAKLLDEALAPFKERGRKIGGRSRSTKIRDTEAAPSMSAPPDGGSALPSAPNALTASRQRNRRIRTWARETQDPDLGESFERGYLPAGMCQRYNEAHPDDRDPASTLTEV